MPTCTVGLDAARTILQERFGHARFRVHLADAGSGRRVAPPGHRGRVREQPARRGPAPRRTRYGHEPAARTTLLRAGRTGVAHATAHCRPETADRPNVSSSGPVN